MTRVQVEPAQTKAQKREHLGDKISLPATGEMRADLVCFLIQLMSEDLTDQSFLQKIARNKPACLLD